MSYHHIRYQYRNLQQHQLVIVLKSIMRVITLIL